MGGTNPHSACGRMPLSPNSVGGESFLGNMCGSGVMPDATRPMPQCEAECKCKIKCRPPYPNGSVGGENTQRPESCEGQRPENCRNTIGYAPDLSLAMAYVPKQCWEEIYECEAGFNKGTIFKQLDKPWLVNGWRC